MNKENLNPNTANSSRSMLDALHFEKRYENSETEHKVVHRTDPPNIVYYCFCGAICKGKPAWKKHRRNQNSKQRKRQKILHDDSNHFVVETCAIETNQKSIQSPNNDLKDSKNDLRSAELTELFQFLNVSPDVPPIEDPESDSEMVVDEESASNTELPQDSVLIDFPKHDTTLVYPMFPSVLAVGKHLPYQEFVTIIPETEGHHRLIYPQWIHIQQSSYNSRFITVNNSVAILVLRNIFGADGQNINETLTNTTKELYSIQTSSKQKRKKRKEVAGRCYHFGCWRKYTSEPQLTEDSKTHPYFNTWKQKNTPVFNNINKLFAHHFPLLHTWYQARASKLPTSFGSFATCVLNP